MILWLFLISVCFGHEFRPGVLSVEEGHEGRVRVHWVPAPLKPPSALSAALPAHCIGERKSGVFWLQCGSEGLEGEVGVEGTFGVTEEVVLRWRLHGTADWSSASLTASNPKIDTSSRAESTRASVLPAIRSGVSHIWLGTDHLLFVTLLVLLIGFSRQLVWVVTLFTVGHSVSLIGFSVFGLSVSPLWVEPMIALTVAFMARECLVSEDSATQRAPLAVALGFGLIHGLGFSTAMREMGHSSTNLGRVLFGFNLGVEIGQLLFLLAIWVPLLLLQRWTGNGGRKAVAYCAGGLAICWIFQRIEVLWW